MTQNERTKLLSAYHIMSHPVPESRVKRKLCFKYLRVTEIAFYKIGEGSEGF